jgi:2-polyprenyl-6-methoxyphenol hydroxylase-like FAD-dependent oxidoreductase
MLAELLTTPHLPAPQALASYENLPKPEAQSLQRLAQATSEAMRTHSSPAAIFQSVIPGIVPTAP